ISTFAGVTVNGQGCLVAFRDPRPAMIQCIRWHANDTLRPDFGFFTPLLQSPIDWYANNSYLNTGNVLAFSGLEASDSGQYYARRAAVPTISLFPNLQTVQSRTIALQMCCVPIVDSVSRTIQTGDSVLWGGVQRKTTGRYSDTAIGRAPNGCDSIHVLNLRVVNCNLTVQLTRLEDCLTAVATSAYPIRSSVWSNGARSQTICVQSSGRYAVTVTDSLGCTATDSLNVVLLPKYRLDTAQLDCRNSQTCMPILLTRSLRQGTGFTVRLTYNPTQVQPNVRSSHAYQYLMNNRTGGYLQQDTSNHTLVLTFGPTNGTTMNGNIGDTLICISWLAATNNLPNHTIAPITGLIEESIQNRDGFFANALTTQIRLLTQTEGLLVWLTNANNALHTQSTPTYPTTVKMGIPNQMSVAGTVSAGQVLIQSIQGNHLQATRALPPVLGIPDFNGVDANLLFLLIAGSNDARVMNLSTTQLIAADINGDGFYTAADLTEFEYRATRELTGFMQNTGIRQSWRFFLKSKLTTDLTYRISYMRYVDSTSGLRIMRYRIPRIEATMPLDNAYLARCDLKTIDVKACLIGDIDVSNTDMRKGKMTDQVVLRIPPCPNLIRLIPVYFKSDSLVYGVDAIIENFNVNMLFLGIDSVRAGVQVVPVFSSNPQKAVILAYSTSAAPIVADTTRPLYYLRVQYPNATWQPEAFGNMTWYINNSIARTNIQTDICTGDDDKKIPPPPFIKVYPNPSSGIVTVESDKSVGMIRVYDAIGRLLLNQDASDLRTDLDLTPFASGWYVVRIGNQSFKIVKE
ncbi:MAG: hypothetical protein RIS64_4293, partial [Bacteroidota bacterium]